MLIMGVIKRIESRMTKRSLLIVLFRNHFKHLLQLEQIDEK